MATLNEAEFERICSGIREDQEAILKHNPIGTREETLLWMLLSVLISYLSLKEQETPCFTGRPDKNTYLEAVLFVIDRKKATSFDAKPYIDRLLKE